jgi:tRNA dimethylallyltransferase
VARIGLTSNEDMLCFSLILLWIFNFLHSGPGNSSYSRKAQMIRRPILLLSSKTSSAYFSSLSSTLRMNSRKRATPDSFPTNISPALMPKSRSIASSTTLAAATAENEQQYRPLVIVIAGPTAVGKSDVASKLCSSPVASDIYNSHRSSQTSHYKTNATTNANRGHIVSADSVQAYRGVDIGANKPTLEEMERTPHHLINLVDPPTDSKAASYNAADWMRDATYVIRELSLTYDDLDENEIENLDADAILRRQSIDAYLQQTLDGASVDKRQPILPVVVGGTMMYLNWFVHGRPDATRPTNEAIERAAAKIDSFREIQRSDGVDEDEESLDAAAWKDASTYVSSLGPVFEKRVKKLQGKDWYRLRRLLEVAYTISSEKMKKGGDEKITEDDVLKNLTEEEVYTGIRSDSIKEQYDVRCFFLCPHDRMLHFATVDQRCEQMLERGLLRETTNLFVSGGLPDDSQVTRAIGYRQALEYLQRSDATNEDHESLVTFIDNFATATRQYAKKQMQWFRRDDDFVFVPVRMDCGKEERSSEAANIIAKMCKLSAASFEAELASPGGGDNVPLSAQTKIENELQGKKMKFFMSKRITLTEGSAEFLALLKEADACTKIVQDEMKSKVT